MILKIFYDVIFYFFGEKFQIVISRKLMVFALIEYGHNDNAFQEFISHTSCTNSFSRSTCDYIVSITVGVGKPLFNFDKIVISQYIIFQQSQQNKI